MDDHKIAEMADWEDSKENIQALPQGRKAQTLSYLFKDLPSNPFERDSILKQTQLSFEMKIQQIADDDDDPLQLYYSYFDWVLGTQVSLNAATNSLLFKLIESICKKFVADQRYQSDIRFIKIWIEYCRLAAEPAEVFQFMLATGLGSKVSSFYIEYAAFLEFSMKNWKKADEILQLGLNRLAQPLEKLKKYSVEFQRRAISSTASTNLTADAGMGGLCASTTKSMKLDSQASQKNESKASSFSIYQDAENSQSSNKLADLEIKWKFASQQQKSKENMHIPTEWLGQKMRCNIAAASAPKVKIYKDPHKELKGFNENLIYPEAGIELTFEEIRARWYARKESMRNILPPEMSVELLAAEKFVIESPKEFLSKKQMAEMVLPSPTINTKAALEEIMKMFSEPIHPAESDNFRNIDNDTFDFAPLKTSLPLNLKPCPLEDPDEIKSLLRKEEDGSKKIDAVQVEKLENPFLNERKELRSCLKQKPANVLAERTALSAETIISNSINSISPVSTSLTDIDFYQYPDYHSHKENADCNLTLLHSFAEDDQRIVVGNDVHYVKKKIRSAYSSECFLGEFITTRLGFINSDDITVNPTSSMIKITCPSNKLEFHILKQMQIVSTQPRYFLKSKAYHEYRNLGMMVLENKDQGTLEQTVSLYELQSGMPNLLALFYFAQVLQIVDTMHQELMLAHCNLYANAFFIRLEEVDDAIWSAGYARNGKNGWSSKGLVLGNMEKACSLTRDTQKIDYLSLATIAQRLSKVAKVNNHLNATFDWTKWIHQLSNVSCDSLKDLIDEAANILEQSKSAIPSLKSLLKKNEILIYEKLDQIFIS